MAIDQESFNLDLYKLLKTRGYKPVPKDAKNQRTQPEEAEVFNFTFTKQGKDYGNAWVTIDDAQNVVLYYDNEQEESPSGKSPGLDYDDSWSGFKKHLKQWSMAKQLTFELRNKDELGDDMTQRDYVKKKEKLGEGYHAMGRKASYNDNIPSVKIILQHNRQLEEGEQRYRSIAKIFLENTNGERFLAPTTRPGIAQIYARHIAEGGVPNDERWNHIKALCEEYSKMAGFVRATKNKQFNESAQQLVSEGINHYQSLRETLGKLRGHRGYNQYFESWTPALMEDDTNVESINELFVQETVDSRIESVMPILSRLNKSKATNTVKEVSELEEWAEQIVEQDVTEGLRLPRYEYGKVSQAYKLAKQWLALHGTNGYDYFDFPDYAGMPKNIANKLSTDEVDFIQKYWDQQGVAEDNKVGKEGAVGKLVGVSENVNVVPGKSVKHLADLIRKYNAAQYKEHVMYLKRGSNRANDWYDNRDQLSKASNAIEKEIMKHYGNLKDNNGESLKSVGLSAYDTSDANAFAKAFMSPNDAVRESVSIEDGTPEHQVIMDLINGNLDAYDVMNHPKTPEQQKVASIMQDMYDDITTTNPLHADDDFDKILNIVVDRLADDYGTSLNEDAQESVANALYRRVAHGRIDLLKKYGIEAINNAIDEVSSRFARQELDEIGTSDVSAWIKDVERILASSSRVNEGQENTDDEDKTNERWKFSTMDYDEAVKKYGKDKVRKGPENKAGKPTIEILSKLNEGADDLEAIKRLLK